MWWEMVGMGINVFWIFWWWWWYLMERLATKPSYVITLHFYQHVSRETFISNYIFIHDINNLILS